MVEQYKGDLSGRLPASRSALMLPVNAVGATRIKGGIEVAELKSVLSKLRRRHALLAVRMTLDEQGEAWYETEGVGENPVRVVDVAGGG